MSKGSIYGAQSQAICRLFEEAGDPKRVMCVPIDYANADHTVLFCNGYGEVLRQPFTVKNTPEGMAYLVQQIQATCRHRDISPRHVFCGGEDGGPYALNFIEALRAQAWMVCGVNAHDAKKQRENLQASTDKLDLLGIAKVLLNRQGNAEPAQQGLYRNLRNLSRTRRTAVRMATAVTNRIHGLVDQLFPKFLEAKLSGIEPFSAGCLWLMEQRFSAQQIRQRKLLSLIHGLQRCGTPNPEGRAKTLQAHAGNTFCAPTAYLGTLQQALKGQVALYRCLLAGIEDYERQMAVWLTQTPGALLTTWPGIGITLAAGVTAELGDLGQQKAQHSLRQIVSYVGIIPRSFQSGGPEQKAHSGHVAKRCNRILKDYVVQSAVHVGQQGPENLRQDYARRQANGQHADFGLARRYLRAAIHMMLHGEIYLPPALRQAHCPKEQRLAYYLDLWPKVREKWARLGALEEAVAAGRPLGQWKNMVEELYEVTLPLKKNITACR